MNYEQEIIELKNRIKELEKIVFSNTKPVLINNNSNRDKTKYMFEKKVYPKNRLVLAVISKYVKLKNPSYEQLNNIFDKSLQGSLNVVETYENALKISDASKRYFIKEQDILTLRGKTKAVVCTQWGIFNIGKFVKVAKSLGFEIETI